jgi:CBS domain containing-hemolysin-like protein
MLRKIPKRTDFVKFSGYKFEVVDIDSYRIDQLLVTRIDERPPVLNVNKNTVDESESSQDRD